eukprot:GCRY01000408.1.p1 GENE.GCRY01000408.1~~GCRY01000408.1.p1  ORF type:complete len:285 (-),score=29.54 GCRY01000408.1:426-1280(-)
MDSRILFLVLFAAFLPFCWGSIFNKTESVQALYFASSSYCNISTTSYDCPHCKIPDYTEGFEVTFTKTISKENLFVFGGVLDSQKKIVISFRGTVFSSLKNWLVDLETYKTDYDWPGVPPVPGARVHKGFYKAYSLLKDSVLTHIDHLMTIHPDYELLLSGHSLGGAQTYLLATDLVARNVSFNIYTFGCPRIGNDEFSEYFSQLIPHYRVTYDSDPVPLLPPSHFGFHHSSTEYYVKKEHTAFLSITKCDGSGEDHSCIEGVHLVNPWDHTRYYNMRIGTDAC